MNSQAIIEEIEKLLYNEQLDLYETLYPIIFHSPSNVAHYLKDIHISTAFYWRHKVMESLKALEPDELSGLVESDEKFFLESHKERARLSRKLCVNLGREGVKLNSGA